MSFLQPGLRKAISLASKSTFVCRPCARQLAVPSRFTQAVHSIVRSRGYATTPNPTATKQWQTNLASARHKIAAEAAQDVNGSSGKGFPEVTSKSVAYWLFASAASVFGIVVFGGLTRLTESGLSITEWRPVTGSLPPMSQADWEQEFTKYRASPEYKMINPHMDLDEFKKIYYMEWTHRLWGRFIGVSFLLPAIYFIARRRVSKVMAWNLVGITGLIGFQGFIGWWMVKSGLKDDLFAPGSHPRVSQYRLAAHLATAFVCYTWMFCAARMIIRSHSLLANPELASKVIAMLANPAVQPFRRYAYILTALIFLTAMSGAFVAGLDAGLIYNEFPMMGTGLTPPSKELWDSFYSRKHDRSDLWWRNMLENPSTVQLDHRILATTTFCAVLALFAYSRRPSMANALPKGLKKGMTGVLHLTLLQVTLGISTLIYMVPTHLAAMHQAGALALLSGALVLLCRGKVPKSTIRLVEKKLKDVKAAAPKSQ